MNKIFADKLIQSRIVFRHQRPRSRPHIRKIFVTALASVVLLAGLSEDVQARRRRRPKGNVVVNQILNLDGTLTNNGQPALEFSGVKPGDLLETGEKSTAVIRIPGLGLFRMGPQTQLKMTSFMDRNETKLELLKGELLALYRRVGVHELKSANGVVSPKSATFFLTSRPGEKSDLLCLCKGKLILPQVVPEAPKAVTENGPKVAEGAQISTEAGGREAPIGAMQITADGEHKLFHLSTKTIEPQESSSPRAHSDALIQDLESLYALP